MPNQRIIPNGWPTNDNQRKTRNWKTLQTNNTTQTRIQTRNRTTRRLGRILLYLRRHQQHKIRSTRHRQRMVQNHSHLHNKKRMNEKYTQWKNTNIYHWKCSTCTSKYDCKTTAKYCCTTQEPEIQVGLKRANKPSRATQPNK